MIIGQNPSANYHETPVLEPQASSTPVQIVLSSPGSPHQSHSSVWTPSTPNRFCYHETPVLEPQASSTPVQNVFSSPDSTNESDSSVWTPSTPKRFCSSNSGAVFSEFLMEIEETMKVYTIPELMKILEKHVTGDSREQRDIRNYLLENEKVFLASLKTYASKDIIIEHDGTWRNVLVCAKKSLYGIMRSSYQKVDDSKSISNIRRSMASSTTQRFDGSFSHQFVRANTAPTMLQNAVSFLCYGSSEMCTFDVLCLSDSIYYNHRKSVRKENEVSYHHSW